MSDVTDDLKAALTAVQAAVDADAAQEPTVGDQILEAITPVLTAAGWTAPAVTVPVTTPATPAE